MKKDIRMIALDLDGTLFNDHKEITARTKAVLNECIQRGILVIPATGRPATGFPKVLAEIPRIRYGLTSNGALVYDFAEQKNIYEALIPLNDALALLHFSHRYDVMCDAYIDGYGYSLRQNLDNIRHFFDSESMISYILSTRRQVENMEEFLTANGQRGVEKMVFFFGDLSLQQTILKDWQGFDRFQISAALKNNLEFNAAGANKGNSLLRFGAQLGFTREQIMACGDGLNDIDMIRAAGFGVAMGNAVPAIKEAADYITLTNEEDGVAAVIEKFVL